MTAHDIQHLIDHLTRLVDQQAHIEGGFIVDSGGRMLASVGLDVRDEHHLAGLITSLCTLSRELALEQGIGEPQQIFVKATDGYVVNLYAGFGPDAITAWVVMKQPMGH